MTGPGTPDEQALAGELKALLDREGILLAPDRLAALLPEFRDIRSQVAMVNGACPAEGEPAVVFALPALAPPVPDAPR